MSTRKDETQTPKATKPIAPAQDKFAPLIRYLENRLYSPWAPENVAEAKRLIDAIRSQ